MPVERLSPLDASFLSAETGSAHMHVGWIAVLDPPEDDEPLTFAEIRAHVAARLDRAPRYRQRLQPVPLDLNAPAWVDDPEFDLDRHLRRSAVRDLDDLADAVLSEPLARDRPLWQIWVADRLDDGSVGLVGKMHHCMVDGLAAVELASMLLDADPGRPDLPEPLIIRRSKAAPDPFAMLTTGLVDRVSGQVQASLRAATHPLAIPRATRRFARTLASAAIPPAPPSFLNRPSSPRRHLARAMRPLDDLRAVRARWETTVNDVLLAAVAGALGRFVEDCPPLKAMVPVSVRAEDEVLGNRISFIFVELPCDEPDPVIRLMRVNRATQTRKQAGAADAADDAVQALGLAPQTVQRAVAGLVASPRLFNLTVSNIPGPPIPLYLRGARLRAAWPVVPLADAHAVSVGMTTVDGDACLGVYADAGVLPESDALAGCLDDALDELVAAS